MDPEYLRKILTYIPETGSLIWNKRTPDMFSNSCRPKNACAVWNSQNADRPAFTSKDTSGHLKGPVKGKTALAHRVAWTMYYGSPPEKGFEIDHINRDKTDNRIENLRLATGAQNRANRGLMSSNSSGFKGVSWHKATGKWCAQIRIENKSIHLGVYFTKELAAQAYAEAETLHRGEFSYTRAW